MAAVRSITCSFIKMADTWLRTAVLAVLGTVAAFAVTAIS